MRTRSLVILLLSLALLGVGALSYFGSRGRLPPSLANAYGTVAAVASSASQIFSAAPPAPEVPEAGVAAAPVPRVKQAAPLSSAQLSAPLVHGRFVSDCGAPDTMKVVVKVTVKKGKAIGAKATTTPPDPVVSACVEKAIREMPWDISPATQHLTVTY
ncbi:MAG TPA: hypothetical protein VHV30_05125 [Polyangiaceae bacterium]|jgi:hypothetical protein|nr:hypothetical protein [Polyangiaceae bacterium]